MISLLSFVAVLSVLVIVHEFGHFITAKRMGVLVEKFSIGFGPEILGITRDQTRYSVSLVPLGGYVKLKGETDSSGLKGEKSEYLSRSVGERARIIFAGPLLNYALAFFIFSSVFMAGNPTLTTKVGRLMPGYPGEAAGLKPGDKILKINNRDVKYWDDITRIVHSNKSDEMRLVVERAGVNSEIVIKPKPENMKTMFGSSKKVSLIGIMPSEDVVYVKYSPPKALYMGFQKVIDLTYITFRALWASFTGAIPFKESITGPIGIFYITGQAAKMGIVYLLQLTGVLSASLAIFNILPVPVLDGGHLLFLAIEKIRKRPVSIKAQDNITQVGFGLLILLMVFVFYNDFMRFGIFEKILHIWKK